jgi:hypothetical protein
MKWIPLALVLSCAILSGCGAIDWIAGIDEHGNDLPGASPAETASPWANTLLPGAGALLLGVTNLWTAIRGRAWRKVAESTFDVIERTQDMTVSIDELKGELAKAHDLAGVISLAKKIVAKYDK